jgi:hypothetical protein
LIALSIGERLIVSNVRDAPPLANEKPGVPLPSDDALYDAAANPDAAQGRGVGVGAGVGDGDGAGNAGDDAGGVCAETGAVPRAHAAVKAAMKVRKISPSFEVKRKKRPCELAPRTAVDAVVNAAAGAASAYAAVGSASGTLCVRVCLTGGAAGSTNHAAIKAKNATSEAMISTSGSLRL